MLWIKSSLLGLIDQYGVPALFGTTCRFWR